MFHLTLYRAVHIYHSQLLCYLSGIILKECLFPLRLKCVSLIFPWGLVCYHLLNRRHSDKVYYAHCACISFLKRLYA